eukprot:139888-Pyramimonas_sp.AAC.1
MDFLLKREKLQLLKKTKASLRVMDIGGQNAPAEGRYRPKARMRRACQIRAPPAQCLISAKSPSSRPSTARCPAAAAAAADM